MRTPFQEARGRSTARRCRARVAEGIRFLWREPFIRTTTFLYGLSNFIGPGLLLVVMVVGDRQGLSSGAIGLLLALFGVGVLAGSLASPLFRRALSDTGDPAARAVDVDRVVPVRPPARRLRAGGVHPAVVRSPSR